LIIDFKGFSRAIITDQGLTPNTQGWCLNRLGKKEESLRSFIKAATFSQDHEEKELIESAIPHRIDTLYSSNYFGCYHEKIRKGV